MRTKTIKIFGIIISILMTLVAVGPAVNGMIYNINNSQYEKNDQINCSSNNYDLIATLKDIELISDVPEQRDVNDDGEIDGWCSIYLVKYTIYNDGPDNFKGAIRTSVRPENDTVWIDAWFENESGKDLFLQKKEIISRTHEVEVLTGDDSNNLEYRVCDKNIVLETFGGIGDSNTINNMDIKRTIKYWRDTDDHIPTFSQINALASTRTEIKTININGNKIDIKIPSKLFERGNRLPGLKFNGITLEQAIHSGKFQSLKTWANSQSWDGWDELKALIEKFLQKLDEFFDIFWEDLPSKLNNNRFGWVKNFTRYALTLSVEIGLFLLVAGSCVLTVINSPEFAFINEWLKNVFEFIEAITTSSVDAGLISALIESVFGVTVIGKIIDYASNIIDLILICGGIELFLFLAINHTINQWANFHSQAPWRSDITIKGKVDYCSPEEKIIVKCRGVPKECTAPTGNKNFYTVDYNFLVPSDPMYHEICYRQPHKCQITVKSLTDEKHKKIPLNSLAVLSYCFSGGQVYKRFSDERWSYSKGKSINNVVKAKDNFLTHYLNILKNKPLFIFLNNYSIFNIILSKQESGLEKQSTLDVFKPTMNNEIMNYSTII